MLANQRAPASNDSPRGDSDYDIILAALSETARGRAFLQEYAQRNRVADTEALLTAIGRIEELLASRSLEPIEPPSQNDNPAPDAIEARDIQPAIIEPAADVAAETCNIDMMADGIVETDDAMTVAASKVEPLTVEVAEIRTVSVARVNVSERPDADVPHASAIEFLGPELAAAAPAKREEIRAVERPQPAPRDPFADIRALSYEEKIALFT